MSLSAPPAIAKTEFWRTADPVMDEEGRVIRGGMWPHQREWWHLPGFVRGLVTGYGGGKTLTLSKRAIWLSLVNAPVAVATVSPTYPMAKMMFVATIEELLIGRQTIEPGLRYELIQTPPYQFTITLGSRVATIYCMSGEKPKRLKGSNLAAALIDEPFIQERSVLEQMLARVRHPQAKVLELDLGGTPEDLNWGYDLLEGELRAKYDSRFVQASSRANLALPRGYVERLETGYDEKTREAYVEGKFCNLSVGQVYYSFAASRNVASLPIPPGAELGVGMDFNVNPMSWVAFWRLGDRVHVFYEREMPNSDTAEACAEIGALNRRIATGGVQPVRIVYPDASGSARKTAAGGKSDHDQIRASGLHVQTRPANPSRRDRYNAVNVAFQKGRLTIAPECKKLISYLMRYTHEGMNRDDQKAMSHLLDAFGYPVHYLMPAVERGPAELDFRY